MGKGILFTILAIVGFIVFNVVGHTAREAFESQFPYFWTVAFSIVGLAIAIYFVIAILED